MKQLNTSKPYTVYADLVLELLDRRITHCRYSPRREDI